MPPQDSKSRVWSVFFRVIKEHLSQCYNAADECLPTSSQTTVQLRGAEDEDEYKEENNKKIVVFSRDSMTIRKTGLATTGGN